MRLKIMSKTVKFLLFIAFILLTDSLSAQTKTPYQKKTESLTIQFLNNLGVSPSIIKKYSDTGDLGTLLFLSNISEKLKTEKGMLAFLKFQQDLKTAEKLKNATDFKRDADKKATEEKKREAQLAKEREREKQREAAELEQERIREFEDSDYSRIGLAIKNQFEDWAKKGEFEKTTDYESRIMKEGSGRFDSICTDVLNDRTKPYLLKDEEYYSDNNRWLDIRLKNYDADNELYYISIFKEQEGKDKDILTGTLKVGVKDAQDLQHEFSTYRKYIEQKDWIFYNNNLVPSRVTFFRRNTSLNNGEPTQYTVIFSSENKQPIVYSTEALKINISGLPQFSFDYASHVDNNSR